MADNPTHKNFSSLVSEVIIGALGQCRRRSNDNYLCGTSSLATSFYKIAGLLDRHRPVAWWKGKYLKSNN